MNRFTPCSVLTPVVLICTLALLSPPLSAEENCGGRYIGASSSQKLGCIPGEAGDPIRGVTAGCTYQDLQKYGSMGRQVATTLPYGIINYTWTNKYNDIDSMSRNIRYEAWDPDSWCFGGPLGEDIGGDLNFPNMSGFTVFESVPNGTVINANQWDRNFDPTSPNFHTNIYQNQTPAQADFVGGVVDTTLGCAIPGCPDFIWPQIAYTHDSTNPIYHLVTSTDLPDGENVAMYSRKIGKYNVGTWDDEFFIENAEYHRSFLIAASRQSERVAIAWSGGRGDGTPGGASVSRFNGELSGKNDNDIYYMISADAGATWSVATNITLRPDADPGGWAPQRKLSLLFDPSDNLHIVWQAVAWPGYDGEFTTQGRMMHWDESSNTVRTAVDANWDPIMCNGGENMLNFDNPQLSWCADKLYLTFTQFAPVPLGRGDDCSERATIDGFGAANGDIFLSVSSNGGFNWDAPRNLTNTYTPGCDAVIGGAFPDCDSDVWHSAIRYGFDIVDSTTSSGDYDGMPILTHNLDATYSGNDYLFLQYINDSDPGAAVLGEGSWTNNMVKAIRFGCVDAVSGAVVASSLPENLILEDSSLFLSGADSSVIWTLENIGDVDINDLSVTVTSTNLPGNVTVSGFGSTVLSGASNTTSGTIVMNATHLFPPFSASAEIIVDGTFLGAPKTFTLSYANPTQNCCDKQGDADNSGEVNIADATFLISYIFTGGAAPPCCAEGDANGNGRITIADATYIIAFIFTGGAEPLCGPIGTGC